MAKSGGTAVVDDEETFVEKDLTDEGLADLWEPDGNLPEETDDGEDGADEAGDEAPDSGDGEPPVDDTSAKGDESDDPGSAEDDDAEGAGELFGSVEIPEHLKDATREDLWAINNELRSGLNKKMTELQKELEAERAARSEAEDGYWDEEPDAPDGAQIMQVAQQRPLEAFQMALDAGSEHDAMTVISQVEGEAQQWNAAVSQAVSQGLDQSQVQQMQQTAQSANLAAEQLRGALHSYQVNKAAEPQRQFQRQQSIAQAEQAMRQKTEGKWDQRRDDVISVLQTHPGLLHGAESAQELYAAYEAAYDIASSRSSTVPDTTGIDKVAEEAVERALAARRKAKSDAASAAQPASGGRTVPAEGSPDPAQELHDQTYEDAERGARGAKAFFEM